MSVIKKVLANVAQLLTRNEQTIAKNNIGLGDAVLQPPVNPNVILAGSLVWDPDHTAVYRLLEDWSYTQQWSSIAKKVMVAPVQESNPLGIDLNIDELNTTVSGIHSKITIVSRFGKPFIRLRVGTDDYEIFELSEKSVVPSNTYHKFRAWQPQSGGSPTYAYLMQITVSDSDYVDYAAFSTNITQQ